MKEIFKSKSANIQLNTFVSEEKIGDIYSVTIENKMRINERDYSQRFHISTKKQANEIIQFLTENLHKFDNNG